MTTPYGKLLDELAEEMGRALEREEVHIAYSGRTTAGLGVMGADFSLSPVIAPSY